MDSKHICRRFQRLTLSALGFDGTTDRRRRALLAWAGAIPATMGFMVGLSFWMPLGAAPTVSRVRQPVVQPPTTVPASQLADRKLGGQNGQIGRASDGWSVVGVIADDDRRTAVVRQPNGRNVLIREDEVVEEGDAPLRVEIRAESVVLHVGVDARSFPLP